VRRKQAGSGAPERCGSRELIRFAAVILHSNEFLLLESWRVSQNIDGTFDPSAPVARLSWMHASDVGSNDTDPMTWHG
jgi:hypothetical protein